ncbi:MAG TPA: MarR family transcriptional regulator [Gemmatimonadales bacterium]|nr:MarR family transcriptional regulator [Gemmatimonadales bacterium]
MVRSLQAEIKQTRAFRSLEEEAHLNIVRTADLLNRAFASALKPYGLTSTQYNVLRILRGADADGLPSGEVAERMITREPDITRLLDRMEEKGWVRRLRDQEDRRVVRVWITAAGHALVDSLDAPIDSAHRHCLGPLGEASLTQLCDLLGEVRAAENKGT